MRTKTPPGFTISCEGVTCQARGGRGQGQRTCMSLRNLKGSGTRQSKFAAMTASNCRSKRQSPLSLPTHAASTLPALRANMLHASPTCPVLSSIVPHCSGKTPHHKLAAGCVDAIRHLSRSHLKQQFLPAGGNPPPQPSSIP
eukprot:746855-Hanusia_phi.AAC.3